MLEIIKKNLLEEVIKDIVTVGFTDMENGVINYYPNLKWLYFQCNKSIVEFVSVEQYSKIRIQLVNEIRFNLEIDEDMSACRSSIMNIVLTGGDMSINNIIKKLEFINLIDNGEFLLCDALKITLKNEEMLFLDPTFLHGISIGGIEQEKFWMENFIGNVTITN